MVKAVFGGGSFMDQGAMSSFATKEAVAEAIDVLLASGVTTIDTARIYPGSEVALGRQAKRTHFTIDTKVPGGFEPNTAHKDTIVAHAREALDKVAIDQFDILYIHSPDPDIPLDDTLAGINEAHKQGIFRRFGLSNYAPADVQRVYDIAKEKGYPLPQVYQGNYNPVARHLEKDLFPVLRKLGILFYAYSPLAGGFLTKSAADLDAGVGRFNKDALGGMYSGMYDKPSLRAGLQAWNAIADKEGVTKAELAYRWVAYNSALTEEGDGVIFGASKLSQIEQTAASLRKGALSAEAVEGIERLWETVRDEAPVDNYAWSRGSK